MARTKIKWNDLYRRQLEGGHLMGGQQSVCRIGPGAVNANGVSAKVRENRLVVGDARGEHLRGVHRAES